MDRKERNYCHVVWICLEQKFLVMKTKKRVLFCIHLSVNGRIILKWIVRNEFVIMWFGFVWNTIGPLTGLYKM